MEKLTTTAPAQGGNVKTISRYIIAFKAYLVKVGEWIALLGVSI